MICPKCNGKVHVKDTRNNRYKNEVFRQRECRQCGHIFYSVESEVEYSAIENVWKMSDRGFERRNSNYEAGNC